MKDLSGTPDNFAKNIKTVLAFHSEFGNKPKTAEEEYPELDAIATKIFETAINKTNAQQFGRQHESTCPYPRQCILEMVIAKLEAVI